MSGIFSHVEMEAQINDLSKNFNYLEGQNLMIQLCLQTDPQPVTEREGAWEESAQLCSLIILSLSNLGC